MTNDPRVRSAVALLLFVAAGCGTSPPAPVARTLHEAALFYPDQIPALVAKGADIDRLDRDGNTALWMAARVSRTESVRLLLAAGADAGIPGQRGWTPLHCSAFCWKGPDDTEVVRLLLEHGAGPDAVEPEYGETPLHYAVQVARSPGLAQLLIDAGADVDARSNPGQDTALQFAVAQRNHEITELLLKAGASPALRNNVGFVPQQQAPEDNRMAAIFEKYAD